MAEEINLKPTEAEEHIYNTSLKVREFEIDLFWKRALFFGGFIAAAGVAYSSAINKHNIFATIISCFGFVCSLAWSLANRGSKYWQENWETKVNKSEIKVTGPLFKDPEGIQKKGIWGAKKYSVSRLAIALSDYLTIIWLSLMGYQSIKITKKYILIIELKDFIVLGFVVFSILYAITIIIDCRTKDTFKDPNV